MEFFKSNTHINFMAQRRWAAILSVLLFLISISVLLINGLHWGLDFTGGMQVQLHYNKTVDLADVRKRLNDAGFNDAVVISYGTSQDILVTLVPKENQIVAMDNQAQSKLINQLATILSDARVDQVNYIGPQVGKEMLIKSFYAIILALLGTMIYIALRFDLRFSIGSTLALIHDPILILGVFSLLHVEFNLISLAAILTVIGYSLNDTIVIFDRVRENFRKMRKANTFDVLNVSINQTLSRTIMTSALTLTVVIALLFLGGSLLYGFALALMIGIVIGTYSSIYVAGSLAVTLGLSRQHLVPVAKDKDDRP